MEIKHYILIQYPVGFGIVSDKVWGVVTVPTLHMFLKKTYFFVTTPNLLETTQKPTR